MECNCVSVRPRFRFGAAAAVLLAALDTVLSGRCYVPDVAEAVAVSALTGDAEISPPPGGLVTATFKQKVRTSGRVCGVSLRVHVA